MVADDSSFKILGLGHPGDSGFGSLVLRCHHSPSFPFLLSPLTDILSFSLPLATLGVYLLAGVS
jgi:hypothetical protein